MSFTEAYEQMKNEKNIWRTLYDGSIRTLCMRNGEFAALHRWGCWDPAIITPADLDATDWEVVE